MRPQTGILLQVNSGNSVHMADIEFYVQEAMIEVNTSNGPDDSTSLELQFSIGSTSEPESQSGSHDKLSAKSEDAPWFSLVSSDQDWFGSMSLSACESSGDASFRCAVPLPSEGLLFPHDGCMAARTRYCT